MRAGAWTGWQATGYVALTAVLCGLFVGVNLREAIEPPADPTEARLVGMARDVQVAAGGSPFGDAATRPDGRRGPAEAVRRLYAAGRLDRDAGAPPEGARVTVSRDGGGPPDVYLPLRTDGEVVACAHANEDDPLRVECVDDPATDAPGNGFLRYKGGAPYD